jgi:predicted nucleic-acid-binding Zn-ribbon protein
MATPKCPKCEGTRFEIKPIEVAGANYKHNAVICSSCGAILGIEEYYNIGARIQKLAAALKVRLD